MHVDGYVNLMAALINQAIKDYRSCKPGSKEWQTLRIFFLHSELLSGAGIDGRALLRELDRKRLKGVNRLAR